MRFPELSISRIVKAPYTRTMASAARALGHDHEVYDQNFTFNPLTGAVSGAMTRRPRHQTCTGVSPGEWCADRDWDSQNTVSPLIQITVGSVSAGILLCVLLEGKPIGLGVNSGIPPYAWLGVIRQKEANRFAREARAQIVNTLYFTIFAGPVISNLSQQAQ